MDKINKSKKTLADIAAGEKSCTRCKLLQPIENYYIILDTRYTPPREYFLGHCHKCDKIQRDKCRGETNSPKRLALNKRANLLRDNKKENPEHVRHLKDTKRKYLHNNPRNRMLNSARRRAVKYNLEFNLTLNDIVIPELCPLLEVPFIIGTKGNYEFTPSIDRIDNTKGYIKNNIWVITKKANSMKNRATIEQLILFAQNSHKFKIL